MTLARNVKSNKISFHKYIRGKRKTIENVGLLLKGAGVLVTQDMDKAEVLNVFFISAFAKKTKFPGIPRDQRERLEHERCTLVEENQVREHLNKLDIHKPLGPKRMYY